MHRPLTLSFAQPFIDVPRSVAIELFAKMDEILGTLNAIPRGGTVWDSLAASWLVVNVGGWRFQYRIDTANNKVVVVAAAKPDASSAA